MITVRKSDDRGRADHGWLLAQHSFSFANYFDRAHMGFRTLRVLNEDRIAPGAGFPLHPHRDMEILTYVIDGGLEHRDSMGNGEVLQAGEFQLMSAGSGITHSEFNASKSEALHLFQIWIKPSLQSLTPGYQQRGFDGRHNVLRCVVAPEGAGDSLAIHQNVAVYSAVLDSGIRLQHELASGRHAWIQIVRGQVLINQVELSAGDGASISDEAAVSITAETDAEVLLFDLV
jgi:quercetin 2,3-dioxygenase